MDLTPYIENLRRDLLQAAALGDDNTQKTAMALAGAVEPSMRLSLMNALSDLAGEITGALGDTTVEVKLDGREVRLAIERHQQQWTDDAKGDPFGGSFGTKRSQGDPDSDDLDPKAWSQAMRDASNELSRTTVRLFNDLKSQAESAAADQGMSLNSYISRAVSDSVRGKKGPHGRGSYGNPHDRDGRNVSGWIQG